MTHRTAPLVRHPLAAALFVASILPGVAFAQTAKEKALEARIAELDVRSSCWCRRSNNSRARSRRRRLR